MISPKLHAAVSFATVVATSAAAFAQPDEVPEGPSPAASALSITADIATLDDLERSLAESVDPVGRVTDDQAIETLHRVSTAADRITRSTVPASQRQTAAELEVLAYHALAESAQRRDRPTETGLRLMQARTAAEELRAQGSAPASDAGRWWRLVTDLADAQRLDAAGVPSPRAQRMAIDGLRAYIAQSDDRRDAARLTQARTLLVQLAMDAGRADLARRTLADLRDSQPQAAIDPDWADTVEAWLDSISQRVAVPEAWLGTSARQAGPDTPAESAPPAATAWVIEADPALPLARSVRQALASGDYPRVELTLIYAGDGPHAPIVLDRVHRLAGTDPERAALAEMGVTRVPAVVLLNASRRVIASGHGPAVLDALTFAP
ncbi:MAG: hypothetical protein AAF078_01210 [Planctomycetota bacterium]